jgi:hypothetical protein
LITLVVRSCFHTWRGNPQAEEGQQFG